MIPGDVRFVEPGLFFRFFSRLYPLLWGDVGPTLDEMQRHIDEVNAGASAGGADGVRSLHPGPNNNSASRARW